MFRCTLALGALLPICWCQFNISLGSDQTPVTTKLMGYITPSKQWTKGDPTPTYTGGTGIVIRNINDGLVWSPTKQVVPGTFITNDMIGVSIAYPNGNPMCPIGGAGDGYSGNMKKCTENPWLNTVVLAVVGDKMNQLFQVQNMKDVQGNGWSNGVFYAADSNSVDQRCIWFPQSNGWDCPSYWIDGTSYNVGYAAGKPGAGGYSWGNPTLNNPQLGGGGAGCHWNPGGHNIDQFDGDSNNNLVQDRWCQCNYQLKTQGSGKWSAWVEEWIKNGHAKQQFSWMGWFGGENNDGHSARNPGPAWAVDVGMCWVSNPRDMIDIQNQVWLRRFDWNNQLIPNVAWDVDDPQSNRWYWGWNEVPVDAKIVNDAQNWDAIAIKLPAAICPVAKGTKFAGGADSLKCLGSGAQSDLAQQLQWYVNNQNSLVPGKQNVGQHPGSNVVLLREYVKSDVDKDHWQRYFFCEDWNGGNGRFHIVFGKECYIDWGSGPFPPAPSPPTPPAPPAPPAPPPPGPPSPVGKCDPNWDGKIIPGGQGAQGICLDVAGNVAGKGTAVQVWNCNGLQGQHWKWCKDGTLRPMLDENKCLDIPNGEYWKSHLLEIWDCNGHDGQKWMYDQQTMSIHPQKQDTMCLDTENGKVDPGNKALIYKCGDKQGEQWKLVSATPGPAPPAPLPPGPAPPCQSGAAGTFKAKNNMCLDIPTDGAGNFQNGAKLQIWTCKGTPNQSFRWCGDRRIVSDSHPSMCVDVPGSNFDAGKTGVQLQMWACDGTLNTPGQKWANPVNNQVFPQATGCQAPNGMCMDIQNGIHQKGKQVILFSCNNNGEAWQLGGQLANLSFVV
jgi:hypothetical protein